MRNLAQHEILQVKENFDRFISCKNTIDDIHMRLRRTEAEANSTAAVMEVRFSDPLKSWLYGTDLDEAL